MTGKNDLGVKSKTLSRTTDETKMGTGVPQSTVDFFERIDNPPIRSSNVKDFEDCPRKYLYKNRLGIKPHSYHGSLFRGTVVHDILHGLFQGHPTETALRAASVTYSRLMETLVGLADAAGLIGGVSIDKVLVEMEEDYHKARAMALLFWDFCPFDWEEYEVLTAPNGIQMVEKLISAKVPRVPVPALATCDLALVKKGTTDVYIVDHKTTSADARTRAISTRISLQIQLYRYVLQQYLDEWHESEKDYPKYTVRASIHNIIKTPGIKFCPFTKDKAGFHESYIPRLREWYLEAADKSPESPPMIQSFKFFSGPVLPEELHLRLRQMGMASKAMPSIHRFYRVGDYRCHDFNSVCPYLPLCSASPALWPQLVRDRYQISFREDENEEVFGG